MLAYFANLKKKLDIILRVTKPVRNSTSVLKGDLFLSVTDVFLLLL